MDKYSYGTYVNEDKRQIVISGNIGPEAQEKICKSIFILGNESSKFIYLFIDSFGGGIKSAQHIFDAVRNSKVPVHGVVTGKAHSAAFVTLQACHKRIGYPRSEVMNHAPALVSLRADQKDLADKIKELQMLNDQFLKYLKKRSGTSLKQLREWCLKEKVLSAEEALNAGFLDQIHPLKSK